MPALQLAANLLTHETEIFCAVLSRTKTGSAMAEEVAGFVWKARGRVSQRVFVEGWVQDVERAERGASSCRGLWERGFY